MRAAPPAAIALAALVAAGVGAAHGPTPLRGSPLGRSGLRLLVAATPPIVVDIDNGQVTRLTRIAAPGRRPLTVTAVGGRAAVVLAYARPRQGRLWSVSRRVAPLGRGTAVVAAADGRSVWVRSNARGSCSVRRIRLDGRPLTPARTVSCRTTVESVDPNGRYVTLSTGDPSWQGGGEQEVDLWVLDTRTGRLTHVPGMPAFVALKFTSTAWTDDGRLVLLARADGHDVVGVWRPGRRRLALKPLRLPSRDGAGSDTFAVLR